MYGFTKLINIAKCPCVKTGQKKYSAMTYRNTHPFFLVVKSKQWCQVLSFESNTERTDQAHNPQITMVSMLDQIGDDLYHVPWVVD